LQAERAAVSTAHKRSAMAASASGPATRWNSVKPGRVLSRTDTSGRRPSSNAGWAPLIVPQRARSALTLVAAARSIANSLGAASGAGLASALAGASATRLSGSGGGVVRVAEVT
jgi:hypothetical protein